MYAHSGTYGVGCINGEMSNCGSAGSKANETDGMASGTWTCVVFAATPLLISLVVGGADVCGGCATDVEGCTNVVVDVAAGLELANGRGGDIDLVPGQPVVGPGSGWCAFC